MWYKYFKYFVGGVTLILGGGSSEFTVILWWLCTWCWCILFPALSIPCSFCFLLVAIVSPTAILPWHHVAMPMKSEWPPVLASLRHVYSLIHSIWVCNRVGVGDYITMRVEIRAMTIRRCIYVCADTCYLPEHATRDVASMGDNYDRNRKEPMFPMIVPLLLLLLLLLLPSLLLRYCHSNVTYDWTHAFFLCCSCTVYMNAFDNVSESGLIKVIK